MFFDFGFDSFHQERYLLEVFVGNQLVQSQAIDLPPPIAQQQFLQLCQQAKETGQPMTVKMSKDEKIWDNFESKEKVLPCWIEYCSYDKEEN